MNWTEQDILDELQKVKAWGKSSILGTAKVTHVDRSSLWSHCNWDTCKCEQSGWQYIWSCWCTEGGPEVSWQIACEALGRHLWNGYHK